MEELKLVRVCVWWGQERHEGMRVFEEGSGRLFEKY